MSQANDLDVVQHLTGLLLEPVERAEQRAEAELIALPGEREIEPAALEGALQRLFGVGLGQRDQGIADPRRDGLAHHLGALAIDLEAGLEGRVRQRDPLEAPEALEPAVEAVAERAGVARDQERRGDLARHLDRKDQAAEYGAVAAVAAGAAALAQTRFGHDERGVAVASGEHVVDAPRIVLRQEPEALQIVERDLRGFASRMLQPADRAADPRHHQRAQMVAERALLLSEHVDRDRQPQHPDHHRPLGPERPQQHDQGGQPEREADRAGKELAAPPRALGIERRDVRRDLAAKDLRQAALGRARPARGERSALAMAMEVPVAARDVIMPARNVVKVSRRRIIRPYQRARGEGDG